jgi:hypothetical protein
MPVPPARGHPVCSIANEEAAPVAVLFSSRDVLGVLGSFVLVGSAAGSIS